MAARDNGLPPKEAALFKSIVKHYETKQYKKGLKAADAVLKKFPEHGETLAMKGLILNCQERKTEAYDLVALGVKKDMRSHVCWHVYGLLCRSDREYLKHKCYRSALRHDPDNLQILRDLSLLQVQMRDLTGFISTRQHLLTLVTNRNNWFTFGGNARGGRSSQALGIVEAYEKTLRGWSAENDYEHSEMILYKNMILEEDERQAALDHLEKHAEEIVDKLFLLEKRARAARAGAVRGGGAALSPAAQAQPGALRLPRPGLPRARSNARASRSSAGSTRRSTPRVSRRSRCCTRSCRACTRARRCAGGSARLCARPRPLPCRRAHLALPPIRKGVPSLCRPQAALR